MEMKKILIESMFSRAHHSSQYIAAQKKIIVSGGMLIPAKAGEKVAEWFDINDFQIFSLDIIKSEIVLLNTVKVKLNIESGFEMQGVASAVLGEEVIFCGGFLKPQTVPKFGKSAQVSNALFSVDFKTLTSKVYDVTEDAGSAQASLHMLDPSSVALVGGSIQALKLFTNKPMSEDKPCFFEDKCKVFNKMVKSEIEKLEISCENHPDIFSHVLCDTELRLSICVIKRKLKNGEAVSYSCPKCRGLASDKRKKR